MEKLLQSRFKSWPLHKCQEAVESSGAAPVRGLDSLLAAATSSSVIQTAVEEVTSASIQVGKLLLKIYIFSKI